MALTIPQFEDYLRSLGITGQDVEGEMYYYGSGEEPQRYSQGMISEMQGGELQDYQKQQMRSQGYIEMLPDANALWFNQRYGTNFKNGEDYAKWLYGGGSVETGPDGQKYFKTPNGADAYVNAPLSYDAPGSKLGNLVLAGLGGLAGGAFLGPALSGLGGLSSGITTGAAAGFGAGAIGGITEGDLGAALKGGVVGGLAGAAGGGLMDVTGLSDYIGNLTGGDVQATGLSDLADLNQPIVAPADPIEAMYQMTAGNNLTATQAANQAGFGSVQDYLGSINPSWVTGATQLAQTAPSVNQAPATTGTATTSTAPTAMSQQELAQLIESGTAGNAGAGLEAAAVSGGGLTAAQVAALGAGGELSAPLLGNTTNAYQNSGTIGANGALKAGAGTTATGSVLSRILDGTATASDWTSLAGSGLSAGLGVLGANQQADAYKDVADKYLALGAPYRDKLSASYAPGFSMADQPDFMNALNLGADAVARATSTKANTFDPGAQMEMQKYVSGSLALPQLNTYRSQLGTFGNLGTNVAGTTDAASAGQTGNMYNAIGYGLGQITQPQSSTNSALSDLLKRYSTGSTASF